VPTRELIERFFPGTPVNGELGEFESLLSNKKTREVLCFKEQHRWRQYVPGYWDRSRFLPSNGRRLSGRRIFISRAWGGIQKPRAARQARPSSVAPAGRYSQPTKPS
jgi:hypothetical protein